MESSTTTTPVSTPPTSVSSCASDIDDIYPDLHKFIALGCLHFDHPLPLEVKDVGASWSELSNLPDEVKVLIGDEAARLLEAHWIRMFLHLPDEARNTALVRVYILPENWSRRATDRNGRSLRTALRVLFQQLDVSPKAWLGQHSRADVQHFDPWASADNVSLFYLFNKLPSPAPEAVRIKNRFSRRAVEDLLESVAYEPTSDLEEPPMPGLKTRLYPYQARSASLMIQREAAPQLQLDPRFDIRRSPDGKTFYFGARDVSCVQEPSFYEANRGGILAETMGLGKTIICLSVILATKGHIPQIPAVYQTPPRVRSRAGSLKDMAASILGRYAIPAREALEREELYNTIDLGTLKQALDRNTPYYEIPPEIPRMNRNTMIPPPRQLALCTGTIVVVPRNLLHQWQSEIRKHLRKDALRILIMDTVPKRAQKKDALDLEEDSMDFASDLPPPTKLMEYHVVLFTRNRFEQEIQDGTDEKGRRRPAGAPRSCNCPYIGSSNIPNCTCKGQVYESPLKKLHWLRIIIDEGHSFSSSYSNAVLVAKQLQVERRWIVSGTPAKDLVGVEVDLASLDEGSTDARLSRELALEQRKAYNLNEENKKAAKALGIMASNFLMVRPWADSSSDGGLEWDEYIYRHEHTQKKTYSGFSACFRRTLEGLVVKTRPEDVEKDIQLPPKRHRVVYLKPCWFDKMTQNLFVQVLRANAITSERSDIDYLFHKNSVKAKHSLIRNLRQSSFTWTGFSVDDVSSTLDTSAKYLNKEDANCSLEDAHSLFESSQAVSQLATSESWKALSKAHEVGIAVENWPQNSEEYFSLSYPEQPTMIGITQLLQGQSHVDKRILSPDPSEGLDVVGQVAKAKLAEIQEAETETRKKGDGGNAQMHKAGVPSSCVMTTKTSPKKLDTSHPKSNAESATPVKAGPSSDDSIEAPPDRPKSPTLPKKRKLSFSDEAASLPDHSPLRNTCIVGTTSAKLSYLIGKVLAHYTTDKILIFYDGDSTAFYLAQALEMLYINHRIYARTLDNATRSEYVAHFTHDPDIRVLLIDVACGALGLNLNAASVVLIVNPINRPSIEAQVIKRAHRIGQTRPVLVETLVLEGTIEEQIFKQAKQMSRQQHLEAKELEDDAHITGIIQNARILPIAPGEGQGAAKFAPLDAPLGVFGRPGRLSYHHYLGKSEARESRAKKARIGPAERGDRSAGMPARPVPEPFTPPPKPAAQIDAAPQLALSIFGGPRPCVK